MAKATLHQLANPWVIFAILLLVIWALDVAFGDSNDSTPAWLTPFWFAESLAFLGTALAVLVARRHKIKPALPWILAGAGSLLVCVCVLVTEAHWHVQPPDQYNNPIGKIYYPLHNTIPYLTPFHKIEKDYLLSSDVPEFLGTQLFVVVPLAAGYGYIVLRKRTE